MGHERVGVLPHTKSWRDVVGRLSAVATSDAGVSDIAKATLENVRNRFRYLNTDDGVKAAFQFLIALSTLGPSGSSEEHPSTPKIDLSTNPSPLRLASALREWVDAHRQSLEYAEIAKKAAVDTIALWSERQKQQPSLFSEYDNVAEIWGRANNGAGFCEVARLFFSKFTERYLNYFLEREASAVLPDVQQRDQFASQLSQHIDGISKYAFETSRIAQSFAAGWFNNHARQRMPSNDEVEAFLSISFGKLREELLREGSE